MWTGIGIAAGAIGGALIGGMASKDAAGTSAAAADRAAQVQAQMYSTTRSDLSPYRNAGTSALQRLMYLTGVGGGLNEDDPRYKAILDPMIAEIDRQHVEKFGMSAFDPRADARGTNTWVDKAKERARDQYQAQYGSEAPNDPNYGSLTKDFTLNDFQKDPGYEFRLGEGEKAITRSMASRGLSSSTPGLQALMKYNQDYASNEYGVAYGRFREGQSNKFNMLSYLAGTGQNAAAMTGQAGVNTAAGTAQAMMAGGNAQAQGILGSASSMNNALQGGLGNYLYTQRYNQLMQRMPVFSTPPAVSGPTMTQAYGE